jgi:hypothetical protein
MRRAVYVVSLICVAVGAACGGVLKQQYEYEEELYIALDGSATLNMNASVASLVALRGVDLPTDPRARLDRQRVRALFDTPGAGVAVSLSRRDGRRFVHVRVDVADVRHLARIMPFSWSTYEFERRDGVLEYRQIVGAAAARRLPDVGWDGSERVTFRMHVPSEIVFHNSSEDIQRGNILEWEQALADRLKGEPVDLEVHMATESILYTTLLLFGSTILAAGATFAVVLWWFARRGRDVEMAESHP